MKLQQVGASVAVADAESSLQKHFVAVELKEAFVVADGEHRVKGSQVSAVAAKS